MHPLVLVALVIGVVVLLSLRRDRLVTVFLPLCLLIPLEQNIAVGGAHIFASRFIILAVLVRRFTAPVRRLDTIDKLFLAWSICRIIAFLALFRDAGALINQAGFAWDALGGFLALRHMVQNEQDIRTLNRTLAMVAIIIACTMVVEQAAALNVFGYLGSTPSLIPTIRAEKLRAQGPFQHALLAGAFGSTLMPQVLALLTERRSRMLGIAGAAACVLITLFSVSSTSLVTAVAVLFAICIWPVRQYLPAIKASMFSLILLLALVMKAPIWFILARIDLTGSSSGYHRALLIDKFVDHFSDWWLIGTDSNGSWGFDMWDTCNQFVTEGLNGGLVTLILFVAMIRFAYGQVSQYLKSHRQESSRGQYGWLFGCSLFAHCVAFWGIVYFDQTRILWYALLAAVAVINQPADKPLAQAVELQSKPQDAPAAWLSFPENPVR